jgi:hypothetical protein
MPTAMFATAMITIAPMKNQGRVLNVSQPNRIASLGENCMTQIYHFCGRFSKRIAVRRQNPKIRWRDEIDAHLAKLSRHCFQLAIPMLPFVPCPKRTRLPRVKPPAWGEP